MVADGTMLATNIEQYGADMAKFGIDFGLRELAGETFCGWVQTPLSLVTARSPPPSLARCSGSVADSRRLIAERWLLHVLVQFLSTSRPPDPATTRCTVRMTEAATGP